MKGETKTGEKSKATMEVGECSAGGQDKNLQVVCFNCGEIGHFSSACSEPRVCFICHSADHVVKLSCVEATSHDWSILWKCK